jgi:hypothetical protein
METESEKVGVVRIKMTQRGLQASAVVGSFFSVDKLLLGWSARLDGKFECQYEIAWCDGRTISGTYRFRGKGCKRPSLMPFVRADAPRAFLERYETGDF